MWGLALVLFATAGFAVMANDLQGRGTHWAYHVCSNSWGMCDHPEWVAAVAAVLAVAYLVRNRISA